MKLPIASAHAAAHAAMHIVTHTASHTATYCKRLAAFAVFALLAGCASVPFIGNEIRFSNAELSERLAKRFPVEKSVAGLLDVTMTNPRVVPRIEGDMRFGATFDIKVALPLTRKTLNGTLTVSGKPRYDAPTRSIYLMDARVDSVRADNMSDGLSAAFDRRLQSHAGDA
jgi:hypothetical protein